MGGTTEAGAGKKTVLYDCHKKLGAKFTEFGGWEMPVLYTGLVDEHHNVRNNVGIFDVSHMGEVFVKGERAEEFLQYVTSNDLTKIGPGQAQYSLLLNEKGGVVDDIIIYMIDPKYYLICVNAANADKDFAWLNSKNTFGVQLENKSQEYAQVAIQGPKAREVVSAVLGLSPSEISPTSFRPFTFKIMKWATAPGSPEIIVACTGYTGEDGFEIFCPSATGPFLWETLLESGQPHGIKAAGLGARDTLRLEVCYPLHGHELRDDLPAIACGAGWVIKFDKGEFIGKAALQAVKEKGAERTICGLEVLDPGIIREGAQLYPAEATTPEPSQAIGFVSSGTKTPTVGKSVAIGFLPPALAKVGTLVKAEVRGKLLSVKVVRRPFLTPPVSAL